MRRILALTITTIVTFFTSNTASSQTAVCSGSYTTVTANCQNFTIGNGTTGYIQVCLDANNFPSGGGTNCSPGCGFTGGGYPPNMWVYDSGGNIIDNFNAANAVGDCITVPVNDGVATIYGLCLTAGTTISWETIDACGNNVCSGSPPPCFPPGSCDCANPCGAACGFATTPTVADVTSGCPQYEYVPELGPSTTSSSCYTFTAASTSVDFGVIVSSNCVGGNVTAFSWEVYNTGSCGSPLYSGTLASLTMNPLVIGNSYTFCYTFTTPSCTHTSHYPYFVGAEPLEVELKKFNAEALDNAVMLSWDVTSEFENDYFVIETSTDGLNYHEITSIEGNGNSETKTSYLYMDERASEGMNYYQLIGVSKDGDREYLGLAYANYSPVDKFEAVSAEIFNLSGTKIMTLDAKGENVNNLINNSDLQSGFYIVQMIDAVGNTRSFKHYQKSK
ncbi:T9SS type A sorting domain-containing protein [Paracrocinitomix mangrovi]|uniref:T9SS type A sorting domain-containing protein n=1 Tax=Paracrocinitomix mangrovi TaxID=2862509 RepID=UPI001C8DC313|nr:T9SS type A sorting domain-containing protein [Paracrocinitomix mangrovi]UKN00129.1 T9SS type A sorting domain-containing protein [Paracrocinitomix mangrovi]